MTRLERAITPLCVNHPGECGILTLDDSLDAFAARYRLTEMAERTWMFSITSGKATCPGYCYFPFCWPQRSGRPGAFVAG